MRALGYFSLSQSAAGSAGSSFAATRGHGDLTMGVLVEVTKAPDQEHRYLICPGNTYNGRSSCKFVNLARACTKFHGQWTGATSTAIAQKIYEDFIAAANAGAEAEYFKSIRVTTYHNDANRREVYLPRKVEQQAAEPGALSAAQAVDR